MRFSRFDLLRYGKFTDQRIDFPRARRDFHLIVGPNEAGKSTLRSAILDLLFGFPLRTPLDFLHAKADLRLGASIQGEDGALEFIRLKANKNTLRDPEGNTLADNILDAWMGSAGRGFFDKMFGLDHPRLVEGGNSILNAQDDVGQILFQSAAGIASLGGVRDALEEEADSLWAPTKSGKRAYYAARDDLEAATAALKAATVQTRAWSEVNERVQALTASLELQREQQASRHGERSRLERIRRMAPIVQVLRECESQLADLEPVVLFPPDAAAIVAEAEQSRAVALHGLTSRRAEAERLQAQLSDIRIDHAVLGQADAIEALEILRHQYGAHASNIVRSQGQAFLLWQEIASAARELGWEVEDPSEAKASSGALDEMALALRTRLPGQPACMQLEQLLRDHGAIVQALDAALAAENSRQAEFDALEAKLQAISGQEVDSELRAALEAAQARGDLDAALLKAQATAGKLQADLNRGMARLGVDALSLAQLQAVAYPSSGAASAWLAERGALAQDLKAAAQRRDELAATLEMKSLELRQYLQRHRPSTWDDVVQARARRDESWQAIKSGRIELENAAPQFESHLRAADELADSRHDQAQEAAQLQSLQQQLEQEEHKLASAQARHALCEQALNGFDTQWFARRERLGLGHIELDDLPEWLVLKDKVLDAGQVLEQASRELRALQDDIEALRSALRRALAGLPAESADALDGDSLLALRMRAMTHISRADELRVRRDTWMAQAVESRPILLAARQAVQSAQARLNAWQSSWSAALADAGLDGAMATAAVQGALALMNVLTEKLGQMHRIRAERIALQAELDDFVIRAVQVSQAAGVDQAAVSIDDAFALSQDLARRLTQARQAHDRVAALTQAVVAEEAQIRLAEQSMEQARVRLQPLMEKAGVTESHLLEQAIARSDRHRSLTEQLQAAQARLLNEGDGYGRASLQAEIDEADISSLPEQLAGLQSVIEQGAEQQSALAVQVDQAQRELDAIAGADAAARAEAQRQEALARMSDAAERYIKVYTAARMLRWSIDRYREEKQGPMLSRASAIFSQLTLNSFERLRVDFDKNPMVLEGERPDGRLVGIAGMSDGTRDQLYLALRLAALELHLQQAAALPFIADDLFINYDDARSEAGLRALAALSEHTQVIFLSHHHHLTALARRVFGDELNVVTLPE